MVVRWYCLLFLTSLSMAAMERIREKTPFELHKENYNKPMLTGKIIVSGLAVVLAAAYISYKYLTEEENNEDGK